MTMLRGLMSLATIAVVISVASGASFSVGGPNGGWDMTTNVQAWASSQLFVTGDNLVFQYMPSHNVVEVTKTDYDTCQVTTPLQSYNNDGNTVIPLTAPGNRYFICTMIGHCAQGMKLEVNTLATSATLPPGIAVAPENSAQAPASSPLSSPLTTSATLPPGIAVAPENSAQAPASSPLSSPLSAPTLFPFISSVESPLGSSSSAGSSALLESSAKEVNTLAQAMIGIGFGMVTVLFLV